MYPKKKIMLCLRWLDIYIYNPYWYVCTYNYVYTYLYIILQYAVWVTMTFVVGHIARLSKDSPWSFFLENLPKHEIPRVGLIGESLNEKVVCYAALCALLFGAVPGITPCLPGSVLHLFVWRPANRHEIWYVQQIIRRLMVKNEMKWQLWNDSCFWHGLESFCLLLSNRNLCVLWGNL